MPVRGYCFVKMADIEGQNDIAALLRLSAKGQTRHAHGFLKFLKNGFGEPSTGLPIGASDRTRRPLLLLLPLAEQGFREIADWFAALAKAERLHANHCKNALEALLG